MRQAGPTDAAALTDIGAAIAAEARPPAAFSETHCAAWLQAVLAQPAVACFVEELPNGSGDTIIGTVLGCVAGNAYAPADLEARVEYVYVIPEYRHSRVALRLMNCFEQWARSHGARKMFFSGTTGADLDPLARVIGAECVGKNYCKDLGHA